MSGEKTWTPELINKLRDLWEQKTPQLSTAAIGDRLGVSKNAAIAKAHRLDLSERPSPIRYATHRLASDHQAPGSRHSSSLDGSTLPALASLDTALERGPSPAWTAWCDKLSHTEFNRMRRATHKGDCPVVSQRKSLRLWQCTCGASQPWCEVAALAKPPSVVTAKPPVVFSPPAQIIMHRAPPGPTIVVAPTVFKPLQRRSTCCWPTGEGKSMRFCEGIAEAGRPYCLKHCDTAYVKVRSKSEGATTDQPAP